MFGKGTKRVIFYYDFSWNHLESGCPTLICWATLCRSFGQSETLMFIRLTDTHIPLLVKLHSVPGHRNWHKMSFLCSSSSRNEVGENKSRGAGCPHRCCHRPCPCRCPMPQNPANVPNPQQTDACQSTGAFVCFPFATHSDPKKKKKYNNKRKKERGLKKGQSLSCCQ